MKILALSWKLRQAAFSEDKLKNTVTFCNYLATLNDMQQIKKESTK